MSMSILPESLYSREASASSENFTELVSGGHCNMIQRLCVLLLVACYSTGCAAVSPWELNASNDAPEDFPHPSETDRAPMAVSLQRGEIDFKIVPIGSYVSIGCDPDCTYQGTVVHCHGNRLELANCLRKSIVNGDNGQRQGATQCLPWQVVEKPTATHLTVLALPSPEFNPPEMKFTRDDTEVVAIEFLSGRVQQWIEPQLESELSRSDRSPEDTVQAMENVPPGSQIAFVDPSGNRYNALVLNTTRRMVDLRCCVKKDVIQRRDGHDAFRFSLLPICSWSIEWISAFEVVAPPPPEFDAEDFDSGCDLCLGDVIYKSGRRQTQWQLAQDDARMMEFFDEKARPVMERHLTALPVGFRARAR